MKFRIGSAMVIVTMLVTDIVIVAMVIVGDSHCDLLDVVVGW